MTDENEIDSRLNRVYKSSGNKRSLFDDWAATYDEDLVGDLGYVADVEACRLFESLVPDRQARILDVGCGTGLVGRRLHQLGYADIHGNDYAEKMLDKARSTKVYQTLNQHDLTSPIETDLAYDAAIAVGVFGFDQPTAEHLVNITNCLRVGGIAIVTVNGKAWKETGWESKLENFDKKYPGTRLVEIQTIDYLRNEGIDGRLLTLKRC